MRAGCDRLVEELETLLRRAHSINVNHAIAKSGAVAYRILSRMNDCNRIFRPILINVRNSARRSRQEPQPPKDLRLYRITVVGMHLCLRLHIVLDVQCSRLVKGS
jgi:hypothetical protein